MITNGDAVTLDMEFRKERRVRCTGAKVKQRKELTWAGRLASTSSGMTVITDY